MYLSSRYIGFNAIELNLYKTLIFNSNLALRLRLLLKIVVLRKSP